ncbi:molecular chaperone [Shewanella gelidii]|uniref:Molecular chaperone n=1 Tax=Shewanella gelidii TaxID=1642821 RepID=A0A917JQH2_9GAMM|nr:molecular chaperone [Shewanella gelidii]MCL1099256.1 molecular chaperone [Shewanella gelidii]GGI76783.1 molecular chaperone [Shewanella gelidii]
MFVGFDYGSANCAVGIIQNGQVELVKITADSAYMPSMLYAMDRELIAEAVLRILPKNQQAEYSQARSAQLSLAKRVRHELDLDVDEVGVFVGEQALEAYLDMPEEGFYVRSPKSFLGATGLRAEQIGLFEDIVTLMMHHVKCKAELQTHQTLTHAVIGRPVNFQAIGGEDSNQQAQSILRIAANRAGFSQVEFLFEPIAAGMDYEARLTQDKTVLVVDVGGGTTDCSMVRMGPSHCHKTERAQDFLGHSGQRIGGNDLDIALAMYGIMPKMGLHSDLVTGRPMPSKPFWNAVAVNDISAQRDFATLTSRKNIESLIKDAQQPQKLQRLLKVQQQQLGYLIVRQAELSKIALSDAQQTVIDLTCIEANLETSASQSILAQAVTAPMSKVISLMKDVVAQAGVEPDLVYVTGGTAKSPVIYNQISRLFPETEVVIGDHFGSVTAGLTHWAQKAFSSINDSL